MTTLNGLCVLWVILACSFAQVSSDRLVVSVSNPTPVLGTSVMVSCRILKPNGYPVEWKLANTVVGTEKVAATHMMRDCTNNGWFISNRTYYRWESCKKSVKDAAFHDFNMTIIKTRQRDTGQWYCDEMNGPSRKSVYLQVTVPPGAPIVTGFGYVAVGVSHTLTCNATQPGLTAPITYQWFKEGKTDPIKTGATLTFPSTTKVDTATYTCNATNSYGSTETSGRLEVTDQVTSVKLSVSSTSPIEGEIVNLTCTAVGGNPVPILTISSSGSEWVNKSEKTRRLSMQVLVKRDDKEVVCSANVTQVNATVVTDRVVLDVKYPPEVILSTNPSTRVVKENMEDANLRCEASGGNPNKPPNGTIAWYHEGKELVNKTTSELSYGLSRPNRTQAGYYKCLVSNYGGIFAWNSTQLHVIYPAEWDPAFPDRRTSTAGLSKMATFTLHILTNPKPSKVAWLRETPGMVYDPTKSTPSLGNYYQAQVVDERTYKLNFWRVSSSDYGKYRVYVTNDAGTRHFVFTLLPPGPPYPPCCLKVTSSSSVSVTLTFQGKFAGDSSQFFEISYRRFDSKSIPWEKLAGNISDSGSSATITQKISNLMPKTRYEFKVSAYNHHGRSGYSDTIQGTTTALPFPDPNVQARKVENVAIISWEPVRTGTRVEVVSCSAKGLCKTYSGTNITKVGIPVVENIFEQSFFVRYYDGDDLALTSKSVQLKRFPVPTPPFEFPTYGAGIAGFVGGCLLVTVIAVIIWKVKSCRQANASEELELGDDEFDTYPDPYTQVGDGQANGQIRTIAGAESDYHQQYANLAYSFENPRPNGNATHNDPPEEIYVNLNPEEQRNRILRELAASSRPNTNGRLDAEEEESAKEDAGGLSLRLPTGYATPTGVRPNEVAFSTYQSLKGDMHDKGATDEEYMKYDPATGTYVNRP